MKKQVWLPLSVVALTIFILGALVAASLFLIIPLTTPHPAIVDNVEYHLDDSQDYSQDELMSAASVIMDDFKRFDECELLVIRYDEEFSDRERSLLLAPEQSIVFTIDFYASSNASDGLNRDSNYTDFKYYLRQDEDSNEWIVLGYGYA